MSAWVPCSPCRGSGLEIYLEDVRACMWCRGGGIERARDERGRFITDPDNAPVGTTEGDTE